MSKSSYCGVGLPGRFPAMLDRRFSFSFLLLLLGSACGASDATSSLAGGAAGTGGGSGEDARPPICAYGQIVCDGDFSKVCDGQGGFSSVEQCRAGCKDGLGCVTCVPNSGSCAGNVATICNATGTGETTFACDGPGMTCEPDGCHGECSPQSLGMGYQGCEFWPTVTANSVWSDRAHVSDNGAFHFGLLLGNVSTTSSTTVKIGGPVADQSLTLGPGESRSIALDWVADLKGPDWDVPYQPASPTQSVKKAAGAYHVVSDRPIIAYQLSSLEGDIPASRGCPTTGMSTGTACYAYSNDGSILLPSHALASKYVVAGFHAWHKDFSSLPGSGFGRLNMGDFIAITATQPNTEVSIKLRANQSVLAGPDLPRFNPGESTTITMSAGQVVQLFTPGTTDTDTFSGTEINSQDGKPLQVLSGVGCVNIFDADSPCGHIEDSVLPLDALGKDYVIPVLSAGSTADGGVPIAQTIRIQSVSEGTAITFEPKMFNAVTLGKGDVLEQTVTTDVRISSTVPFAVTQYLTGRSSARVSDAIGSPNQLTAAPIGQFRTSYSFLTAPSFASNFVSIIAPTGAKVSIDAVAVAAEKFIAVGASGMSVARMPVTGNRVHALTSDKPVGILVYGIGPYASYAYSGGLDLKRGIGVVIR